MNKITLSILLGVLFWYLAALFIKYYGSFFSTDQNPYLPVLYVLAIPVSWEFIQTAKLVERLADSEVFDSVVVMTMTATLCDGIAITWFPALYGTPPQSYQHLALGAALILWSAGCGLVLGFIMKPKEARKQTSVVENRNVEFRNL